MAKSLEEHYSYSADRVKLASYQAAIEPVVGPETVFLDLGFGSGPLGLIALRASARKVLFVEQEALMRAHPARITLLEQRGRARQIVLSYCDGRRSVAEVEALVLREHPGLFPSASATSSFIRHVLAWDTSE